MIKGKALVVISILAAIMALSLAISFASGSYVINSGETTSRDIFAASQTVRNDGVIKGDFMSIGQNISSYGEVEGDLISLSGNADVHGKVAGDLRNAAGNIIISGNIGKNANIFAGSASISNSTLIGGNLIAFCGNINIDGKVNGHTMIQSNRVILNGEFFGDVDVGTEVGEKEKERRGLTVLSGTIIHGKLTYKGITEADIHDGSKINTFEWVKPEVKTKKPDRSSFFAASVKSFVKLIFTTAVYFLIAALLYKLFPSIFISQDFAIRKKTLNVVGIGFIALISTVAAVIAFILLLGFSAFLISPSIGLIFGVVALLVYIILFYFSTVPVSFWLGNVVLSEKCSPACRLGVGLGIIATGLFILGLLAKLQFAGFLFGFLSFFAIFAIIVIGTGAILYSFRDIYLHIKNVNNF